jgi:hypothetical protein
MKIFLQGLIAAGLMLWLLISSLGLIGQSFIKDAVELHGSRMLGSDVVFSDSSINLADKTVSLHDACFPAMANPSVFCAGTLSLQFSENFLPDFKSKSFFPPLWEIEVFQIKNVAVFYDVDSEGSDFRSLRIRLSQLSEDAMRDRLNARAKDVGAPLLLQIKTLQVSGITVDARSQKNPGRSKVFSIRDIILTDIGMQEEGVAPAEIIDRLTRSIIDAVRREADKLGMLEAKKQFVDVSPSRKQVVARENDHEDNIDPGKTIRSIGTGLKKTGGKMWQGAKDFFN